VLRIADLEVDLVTRRATRRGNALDLTARESDGIDGEHVLPLREAITR